MTQVYKVPKKYLRYLDEAVGLLGTRFNTTVQDINGNTIIGQEEWNSPEFQPFVQRYPNIAAEFVLIDYYPKEIAFYNI